MQKEFSSSLKKREKVGRPRHEEEQPELLKAIINIATHGSSSQSRRNDESLQYVRTLSNEGKRHVSTVPVRLISAENDKHANHPDRQFCKASINQLEEMASILGPSQKFFIRQDDKARV